MTTSSIPLPPLFAANIAAQAAQLFSDWSSYIGLIVGVVLAALVISIIIGAIRN